MRGPTIGSETNLNRVFEGGNAVTELAGTVMFLLLIASLGTFYFCLGRVACPQQERLPLPELGTGDLLATLRRGWHVVGEESVVSNAISEMHRRRR